ncbi:MAG: hypothetical protein K6F50_05805 [Kiritimatiellae bacterium]|nr:hypothetical protein [Kiritimatiellia bacterium]
MVALAAVLWFAEPAPLDMPKAEAYLVTPSEGARRLEDRYDELDLWTARTVLGRWKDRDGRYFTVSRLDTTAPMFLGATMTRSSFAADSEPLPAKDLDALELAIERLSPFEIPDEPAPPRQNIRGMKDVSYWEGTNGTAIVCLFWPENHPSRYLAVWSLAEGDDPDKARETFEEDFLAKWGERVKEGLRSELAMAGAKPPRRADANARRKSLPCERELLRADAFRSVTNYPAWHATAAPEFAVLDDLPPDSTFVRALTNELSAMRRKYAETVPSPLDATNVLAVARIFKDRDEYIGALDDNEISGMEWSGAYWSPRRRELVAYLPPDGGRELLKTFRHEAFHQYLSYACSMIQASPWFNEGYAQYFEDSENPDWGMEVDLEASAELLPAVFGMDYGQFYSGSDIERRLKYRLAWSVAYFLEKGAGEVRFDPFKDVKRTYIESLLRHHDMQLATAEAFGSVDNLNLFVSEWKKFWLEK